MPYALNLYHDQVAAGGATSSALPAAQRMLYVRHGSAVVNGKPMKADEAIHCDGPVTLQSSDGWSQVWRWELALPNAPPALLEGSGVLSSLRMAQVITGFDMLDGSRWLFRLDQITSAAGRIADRHQHPGPGIRCLLEGTFNAEQAGHSARNLFPGDAWWETGPDTVVAWGSPQMAARFLRGMILPVEWEGKVTGTWLSAAARPRPSNWRLLVDKVIAV
jgi:hypothetical protein